MTYNYLAIIQGGLGPDVWDMELPLSAVDFMDATKQAIGYAEEHGGHVVMLEASAPFGPGVQPILAKDETQAS